MSNLTTQVIFYAQIAYAETQRTQFKLKSFIQKVVDVNCRTSDAKMFQLP